MPTLALDTKAQFGIATCTSQCLKIAIYIHTQKTSTLTTKKLQICSDAMDPSFNYHNTNQRVAHDKIEINENGNSFAYLSIPMHRL